MKKRRIALYGITLALSITFAASCSSGTKDSSMLMNEAKFSEDGKPVVTIGTVGFTDEMFLSKNKAAMPKDIIVEIVNYYDGVDKDLPVNEQERIIRQKIDTDFISGNAPDIMIAYSEEIYRLNRLGILADLYQIKIGRAHV